MIRAATPRRRVSAGLLWALLGLTVYAATVPALYERPRPPASPEMAVAMPRFVQVLLAAGDRYLAANLAGFRALVVSTETMDADNYRILGIVQSDAAWLNPAHEDNYYLAAAILPWAGEVAAAQDILRRASDARPFDTGPPFFHGFNIMHFAKRPAEGAQWLLVAASHTADETEKIQWQQMAAQWVAKGEDVALAIRLHREMARQTGHAGFAAFLEKRALRLENLLLLEQGIARYVALTGQPPRRLEDLVARAIIPAIPRDPFAQAYVLDAQGKPQAAPPAATTGGKAR